MDISKNVCHRERQFFFEMKEGYKISFVKVNLLGRWFLFEIMHTSVTAKIVKSGCF